MERIAKFEKVSFEQFLQDHKKIFPNVPENKVREIYDGISLPARATAGSAGYDLFLPAGIFLKPQESVTVLTGIRARIAEGWVLNIYPRSGLGIRNRLRLDNTVGIIDQDYYYSENEGHIMVKITNEGGTALSIGAGKGFVQGIFMPFGITEDDNVSAVRNGGFGSTG